MLKVPTVKNAPFGLPLITGTKIIGFLHLVVYTLIFLVVLVKERQHLVDDDYNHNETEHHDANSTHNNESISESISEELNDAFLDISASYFNDFAVLVQITFAAFLLLGAYQKNVDFIMSWVLLQLANMIFSFFFLVVYFVAVFRIYTRGYIEYLICEEITVSIVVGYCSVVVYSYVTEVTVRARREEPLYPIVENQD